MTYRQAATLACKVLAIITLLQAVELLSNVISMAINFWSWGQRGQVYPFWAEAARFVPPVAQLIIGIWLWKRAGVVAAWITGSELQDSPEEPETDPHRANDHEIQAVVLSSLGVWVLLQVVPQILAMIFQTLFTWMITRQLVRTGGGVDSRIWMWSFDLLLGLWLIFGAPGITRLLRRARGEKLDRTCDDSSDGLASDAR